MWELGIVGLGGRRNVESIEVDAGAGTIGE